jgi:hypothetical protein
MLRQHRLRRLGGGPVGGARGDERLLGDAKGLLGGGALGLRLPSHLPEPNRILRGQRLHLGARAGHAGVEPAAIPTERLDLHPEGDRRLRHGREHRGLGAAVEGAQRPHLLASQLGRGAHGGVALPDQLLLPAPSGVFGLERGLLLRGGRQQAVVLLELAPKGVGVRRRGRQLRAPLTEAATDARQLPFQGRRLAADVREPGVGSGSGADHRGPDHGSVRGHEARVGVDPVLGGRLRQVPDQIDLPEQRDDQPGGPRIVADGLDQAPLRVDRGRHERGLPLHGQGDRPRACCLRVGDGVVPLGVHQRVGVRAEGPADGRPQVRGSVDQVPEHADGPASLQPEERRAGRFGQLRVAGVHDLLASHQALLLGLEGGDPCGQLLPLAVQDAQAFGERRPGRIEAFDLRSQLVHAGLGTPGAAPEILHRLVQSGELGVVPGQGPAQRLRLRAADRPLLADSAALVLRVLAAPAGRSKRRLGRLQLPLAGRQRGVHLGQRLLGPSQLVLQGEQPPGAVLRLRQAFARAGLLPDGLAERLVAGRLRLLRREVLLLGRGAPGVGQRALAVEPRDLRVEVGQALVGLALRGLHVGPGRRATFAVGEQLAQAGGGQPDRELGGLGGERLVTAGQLGLLLEWLQLAAELAHEVLQAVEVGLQAGHLPFGALAAASVLGDPRRLLDELPALLGPGGQHRLQLALPHDRVLGAPHPGVGQQLVDVHQPHGPAAEPVLALARSEQGPADLDLRRGHRDQPGAVVDDHPDLGHPQGRLRGGAGEDHVGHLRASERPRPLFAEHPGDGVDDVGLAGAIGADDHTGARAELERGLVREGLEPAKRQGSKKHGVGKDAIARRRGSPGTRHRKIPTM